jgi:hypothetical protein
MGLAFRHGVFSLSVGGPAKQTPATPHRSEKNAPLLWSGENSFGDPHMGRVPDNGMTIELNLLILYRSETQV